MLPVSRATGRWAPRRSALSATTTWWLAGWRPHGLIRTAHAIRALSTEESPAGLLLDELASGLTFWAATFKLLPGRPELRGPLPLADAVDRLPRPTEPWPMFEAGAFSGNGELAGFPQTVDALGPPKSAGQDPHVLKFSEACAREHAHNPDPVYLLAARHVLDQLQAW